MPVPKDPVKYAEFIQKLSRSIKEKFKNDPEYREKVRKGHVGLQVGEKNPFYGKHHTEESNEKNRQSHLGKPAWNKGVPMKEEQKKKLSKVRTGYKYKNPSPLKGKKRSLEDCRRISEGHIGIACSEEKRKKISISNTGIPKTEEAREKMSLAKRGKPKDIEYFLNTGRLKSFEPYCPKFNAKRKNACRDFFGGFCIVTGEHQNDCRRKHSVHHVDQDKEQGCNGKPFNLVPISSSHHTNEQHHHDEYMIYINKTLREGFKWGIWNEQEYIEKVMYDE